MSEQTSHAAPRRRGPMGGPGRGMMPGEKAKDFKGTVGKLLKYMGKFKLALIFVMIFAIGSTVFNIFGPKILGTATSELFAGLTSKIAGTGGIDFARIAQILLTSWASMSWPPSSPSSRAGS